MKTFLFITLLSVSALSARGQSGEWHSLMSVSNELINMWLSSDKSTIAAESWSGYFIIFETKTGRVLRQTACVPRRATGQPGSNRTNTAQSSITQDTALVLTSDNNFQRPMQWLEMIDVRTGVTLRKINLRELLPDTTRGFFTDLVWDHRSGIVTLGHRRSFDPRYPLNDSYYQLSLQGAEQLVQLDVDVQGQSNAFFSWIHPFVVDRTAYPTNHRGFRRVGTYLLMSDSLRTIVYQAPSAQALWTVNEIPLALIDTIVVTVDVSSQQTHHRRIRDGKVIRSFQHDVDVFYTNATGPNDIFRDQSPSQRFIYTGRLVIDLLNGSSHHVINFACIGITNDGDLINRGNSHGIPFRYTLRKNGHQIQTPPQLIGALSSVFEAPLTSRLIYSTRGLCTSLGGYIAGVVGELTDNVAAVGLILDDGKDINDRHFDGFQLSSLPVSIPGPSKVLGCVALYPQNVPLSSLRLLFDASTMSKIGELSSSSSTYLDPIRGVYYSIDRVARRSSTSELAYHPDPPRICNDTFLVEEQYPTYILKGTGQLVTGKYVYDGKSCVQDSMNLGSAIAVGMMRPLAVLTMNNNLILVDMSTWPVTELWRTTISQRMSVTFADQDHSVRCIDSTGRLHNINVNDGTVETMSLPSWPDSVLRIHWSADGSLITAEPRGDRMITTWDHRGTMMRQLPYPDPHDRRVIVTSETARIFVTTNDFSQSSGFATWWSDGIIPTPTTVQGSPTDLRDELLSYPVHVYSTLGQHITTIAAPSNLTTLQHGLYIFVNADGESRLTYR